MQPYLFPYIGYFQLINAVDTFVIHDDVQYIKGGWINRNRIQINKKDHLFTLSLRRDSSLKNINTRQFSDEFNKEKIHLLTVLKNNYIKAPYFLDTFNLLSNLFDYKEKNISLFIANSLKQICEYLEIKTSFYFSSELNKNNELKGQSRVLDICRLLKADIYINPIGGKAIYVKEEFKRNNISLFFLHTKDITYQTKDRFTLPNLSIIDVMMFNSVNKIRDLLRSYELV